MKIRLKNVGPLIGEHEFELNNDENLGFFLEGKNGVGKTTLIDSFGILMYDINIDKHLGINDDLSEIFIEVEGLKVNGVEYKNIRKDIIKKGSKFLTTLSVNGEFEELDYFEKILPSHDFQLMTNYTYFNSLKIDKKLLDLNSFFKIKNTDVIKKVIGDNMTDIQKKVYEYSYKKNQGITKESIDNDYIKTLYKKGINFYNIQDIDSLSYDDIKSFELNAGRDLKKMELSLSETYKLIQTFNKKELSGDTMEDLNNQLIKIKESKINNLSKYKNLSHYEFLSSISTKRSLSLQDKEYNYQDGNLILKINNENVIITLDTLINVEKYGVLKNNVLKIKEKISSTLKENDLFIELLENNELSTLKFIEELTSKIEGKRGDVQKYINNELIPDEGILKNLYENKINFSIDGTEISSEDKSILINFFRSKFITSEVAKKVTSMNKLLNAIEKDLNELVFENKNLVNIYNTKLSHLNKESFQYVSQHISALKEDVLSIQHNTQNYKKIAQELNIKSIQDEENWLEENSIQLGLTSKDAIEKELSNLDKNEFEITNKIKNLKEISEKTDQYLKLVESYKDTLNKVEFLTVFKQINDLFPNTLYKINFSKLDEKIKEVSGYNLELNIDIEKRIELLYVDSEKNVKIPYKNMSEGIRKLTDNLLLNVFIDLFAKQGKSMNITLIDEISSISDNNRELLLTQLNNNLNKDNYKLIGITNNNEKLEIKNLPIDSIFRLSGNINKESIIIDEPKKITRKKAIK